MVLTTTASYQATMYANKPPNSFVNQAFGGSYQQQLPQIFLKLTRNADNCHVLTGLSAVCAGAWQPLLVGRAEFDLALPGQKLSASSA